MEAYSNIIEFDCNNLGKEIMTRNHTWVSFRHYCNYCNYYCSNEPYYYAICSQLTVAFNPFMQGRQSYSCCCVMGSSVN